MSTPKLLAAALALALLACSDEAPVTDQSTAAPTATDTAAAQPVARENPLFMRSSLSLQAPPFDKIEQGDYQPAIERGMELHAKEIQAIADSAEPASFANTVVAMEKAGADLLRSYKIFSNLTNSTTNDVLRQADEELSPKLAEHMDKIWLNEKLFARVQAVLDGKDSLSAEDRRLVEVIYRNFERAGAKLTAEQKTQLSAINKQLSTLGTKFSQNLQQDTNASALVIDDVKQLDGMDANEIEAAKAAAIERKLEGKYVLTLSNFTLQPQLASLKDRSTRERLYQASINRGNNGNQFDNKDLIRQIVKLRAERAELLGFPSYSHFALDDQMAKTPDAVNKILNDMAKPTLANAKAEAADIQAAIKADGLDFTLEPWDWPHFAEKVRAQKYGLDEAQIRPYFEFERVLQDGLFFTMNKQYGIALKERKDLPVYHPDVRTFDVLEEDGSQIGIIYLDYFARESKRGGAWMDSFVDQSNLLDQKPVVLNVMNIKKAPAGQQTLMTYDDVSTMFHEFGHAVHGLFSKVNYPTLSGTNTPRDFVEFPSQFQEDWSLDPAVLANYAKHYQTGEVMPQALVDKMRKAASFNKGFDGLEALQAQMIDMDFHSLPAAKADIADVIAAEAEFLAARGVAFAPIAPRYRTTYFGHVWPGGYASGYYSYLWTEVLAADAFAYMNTQGGLSRENGDKFRAAILSKGGTAEPMDLFKAYRGQEPSVDGLLKRRGIKK